MVDAKAIKEAGKKHITKAIKAAEKKAVSTTKSKGNGKSKSKISTGKAKSSKNIHNLDPVADAKAKKFPLLNRPSILVRVPSTLGSLASLDQRPPHFLLCYLLHQLKSLSIHPLP